MLDVLLLTGISYQEDRGRKFGSRFVVNETSKYSDYHVLYLN